MNQLALGDASAVVSLKAVIPDREPAGGLLNYGPEPEEREKWTDEQKREKEQKGMAKLKVASQDPLLRRLVTAHILATAVSPDIITLKVRRRRGKPFRTLVQHHSASEFGPDRRLGISRLDFL